MVSEAASRQKEEHGAILSLDQTSEEFKALLSLPNRPTLADAMPVLKLNGTKTVRELWEGFEEIIHAWYGHQNSRLGGGDNDLG